MIKLLIFIFLATSGLIVKGEQLIRCDSTPMNLCGSDLVIYKSECDFLASKAKLSDLTILDLTDCVNGNFSELNATESSSNLDNRSLRGSNISKKDSGITSENVTLSLKNDTEVNLFDLLDDNTKNIVNNYTFVNGSISDEKHLQETPLGNSIYNEDNKLSAFYIFGESRIFPSINRRNVKLINVIVENFDISTFILSGGRYNLSRFSMLVLESVLKILRNQRSNIENYLSQLNSTKLESADSDTTTYPYKALDRKNDSSTIYQREYGGLNVTFKFSNSINANSSLDSQILTDQVFNYSNSANVSGFNDNGDTFNISGIDDHKKAISNRLLVASEDEYTSVKEVDSRNVTDGHFVDNCEVNIPTNQEAPLIPNFHCIFPKNSTGNNLEVVSNNTLSLAQIIFMSTFGNNSNSSLAPYKMLNPLMNITSSSEGNIRFLSSNQSLEGDNQENFVLDFFDLLSSPLNITNDLMDLEIGEIFVNFDFSLLSNGDSIDFSVSNVSNTTNLEEIDDIFKLDSILKDLNLILKSNYTDNSTLSSSLRITSELIPKIDSNYTTDGTSRDFPPAFDRVRGPDCVVKCDEIIDLHCANNGITYKNLCEFRNAQCDDRSLIFVGFGKCLPLVIKT
ncbi:Kazal-type serine protease inhibitor domain protein [Cryptosporidium meleagridis]|uniref:Kazal-type serine protease inhibitor domain protein n=1 Tax=Cryptosporidium meleagridis TaxID=93969 RepID=A0A2P4Z564_9CRYT|nr:Kazal-type serine protease inhibitor domain protein [Cryptosporidium meleagridis]